MSYGGGDPFDALWYLQIRKYYGVFICVLYMCDYIETFEREVEYMWKGPRWNLARVFFFFCRYIPIAQIPLFWSLYIQNLSDKACLGLHVTVPGEWGFTLLWLKAAYWENKPSHRVPYPEIEFAALTLFGEAFPLAILLLCLYALCGSKRKHAPLFWGSYIILMAALIATLTVFLVGTTVPPIEQRAAHCFPIHTPIGKNFMLANRIIRLSAHFVMASLAAWRGLVRYRQSKSPLLKAINKGGMIYYASIFLMAAVDITAKYYSENDPAKLEILAYISRFGAPIMANRLLLKMYKKVRDGNASAAAPTPSVSMKFAARSRSKMQSMAPSEFGSVNLNLKEMDAERGLGVPRESDGRRTTRMSSVTQASSTVISCRSDS